MPLCRITHVSSTVASVLALASGAVQAQEPLAPLATIELLGAPMTMDAPAISELAERARSRGQVRVIASVATPPTLAPSDIDAAAISRLTGEVTSLAAQLGAETAEPIAGLPLAVLEVTEEQLQDLIEAGLIANVIEDVPEPPALADSVPLINADAAAALGADGNGQTIAILDSGVARNHTFFGGRIVAEACFSSNSAVDGATTVCPGGATTSTAAGSAAPCGHRACDHGTHVAGIAAGRDATRTGVAPAADLIAIQVFSLFTDSPGGPRTCANVGTASPCILTYRSDQIRGLQQVFDWRNDFTIAAANMSLGGGDFTTCDDDARKPLVDQLRAEGIATVIASGNDGLTDGVGAPGCITTALTVGNTTKTDAISGTSNSADVVDLLAPGSSITSSILGDDLDNFGPKSGTSMAAPHVAGAVAALRSVRDDLSVDQIEQVLESTGVNITDPRNDLARPRIDLEAAVQRVLMPLVVDGFGQNAGSWRVAQHPRMMADVNNDGRDDIVGFGNEGVHVSLSTSTGPTASFGPSRRVIDGFGQNAGSWRVAQHPRMMADVNNDGRDDIVGFGNEGVHVSLSTSTGPTASFGPSRRVIDGFGQNAGSWRVDQHPRMMADVNNDGRDDIVGFGNEGVHVSLSTSTGPTASFGPSRRVIDGFGQNAGSWRVDQHPRMMADVNNDGRDDIVGFGNEGVHVSVSTSSGTTPSFGPSRRVVDGFAKNAGGWRVDQHPRMMADVNNDGRDDIVGFGNEGVHVSLSTSSGTTPSFGPSRRVVDGFAKNAGGWRVDQHPRMMADVNNDDRDDVVGFGNEGVHVSLSTSTGTTPSFGTSRRVVDGFAKNAGGWRVDQHPRMMADVNNDGRADIVGFGNDGVFVSILVDGE